MEHLQAADQIILAAQGMGEIVQILERIRNALVVILGTLSIVGMTYAGVRYVIAGGDPSGVERAKGAAKSSALGMGLALMAPALVAIVKEIVGK